ncbi:nuclear pore complex protein NUP58-like [Asparagus officinalis]|uniref:nuclear pore complex protein NUP58-like n=1 Tax=Asparagus officinalis TaxID=4686 RepID=UPI00098E6B7A|nr:nuclear pore complex protein NUP58-like [Asparagus officinalis]
MVVIEGRRVLREVGNGAGVVLRSPDRWTHKHSISFNFSTSNNKAEYEALHASLRAAQVVKAEHLYILADSQLVVCQVNGKYVAKDSRMAMYLKAVKELLASFVYFKIVKHVVLRSLGNQKLINLQIHIPKWTDLHPDSQKLLLQIEEHILEYRDESQRLDQCSRLYDSSVSSDNFDLVTSQIIQELGGTSTAMERERITVKELMTEAKNMMWNTEIAIRSYMRLRPRFRHQDPSTTANNQATTDTSMPMYDFYIGLPKRPSPFIQHTVSRFEKYLVECCQWIEELEQLVFMDADKSSSTSGSGLLQSLPNVMSNVHDFFVHVAAKVESLHQYIESMKKAYLADHRRRGDVNDPFLEADRRETAKQEAAARRVHPTLHLPINSAQSSSQSGGLFSSPTMPVSSVQQQPAAGTSTASSGSSGFSLFSTPAAPSSSSSLFSTPTTSAPASNLFGTPSFTPQSTPFGTSSSSLFGSAQTPSLFGSSPSFASTPAMGGSTLFSTPTLTSGAAAGSGASFGAASKTSRPKSRTTRR